MDWYDLDEILATAELPEVARRLGMDVEQRGANLVTRCPFHEDTRPSLVLYPRDAGRHSHYHCFACNAHGYAVDLVKEVQGLDFRPAVEWLARNLGIAPKTGNAVRGIKKDPPREEALAFAQRVFNEKHDESAFIQWCEARRFDRNFLFSFGMRCLPVGSSLVRALKHESFGQRQELIDGLLSAGLLVRLRPDRVLDLQTSLDLSEQFRDYFHDGRVLIPIRDMSDKLLGFAGRFRPPVDSGRANENVIAKYLLTPGFRKADVLFNANVARKAVRESVKAGNVQPVIYVVEGFLDALRLQSLGMSAVAVMGSNLGEKQRTELIELVEGVNLPGDTHLSVRLFFDRDTAGFDGASRAARQLLGRSGMATEWVGFTIEENTSTGKDPDEILASLDRQAGEAILDQHSLPAVGILLAASLGYKDAAPLVSNDLWHSISHYLRERALLQTARSLRALSGASANWEQRLDALAEPRAQWVEDLLALLRPHSLNVSAHASVIESTVLANEEARLNHARMLAEHGSRRGELPCDDETWRVLDRSAQLFNSLARDRLQQTDWRPTAPCDAVHLPRKLSGDANMLADPRRKVMPHPADLHLQQFLINELLTERHDFAHEGPRTFSDCIPAVRWYETEDEIRVTGYVGAHDSDSAIRDDERGRYDEVTLSFAYQVDMDVLEGRRKPSDQGMFRPFMECWRGYMASLSRQAQAIGPHVHVLRLDAKRYYDAIQRYVVRDRLMEPIQQALTVSGGEEFSRLLNRPGHDAKDTAKHLVDLLCGSLFEHGYRHPDNGTERFSDQVIGIPQGPVISAWIGTIAMFPLDAAARAFMREPSQRHPDDPERPRVGYARYVDDIVLLADSEARLNALREAVQNAASHLDLTLVRKGDAVTPGTPETVMQQLNSGRILAASVPAWEPPMVGDGESGWGMSADDSGVMDRQSALHLLRHPGLLDDYATVHEKVREAMQAPDLRPSDLGKCARALWWQVAMQELDRTHPLDTDAWTSLWDAYRQHWEDVCAGHAWAVAYARQGYDILFAIEGLDMLMDWSPSMQKGRTKEWIARHDKALDALAAAILQADDLLQNVPLKRNRAHIRSRVRKVQWKALQRVPGTTLPFHVESQRSTDPTLTEWLCLAAILLNRYDAKKDTKFPLNQLPLGFNLKEALGPETIKTACGYIQAPALGREGRGDSIDPEANKIALQFLVANTGGPPRFSRWEILKKYGDLIGNGIVGSQEISILPPLPVADSGMLAYVQDDNNPGVTLFAFASESNAQPPAQFVGATMTEAGAQAVSPLALTWGASDTLAHGLHRSVGQQSLKIVFNSLAPANRARFAADLYETLHVIQQTSAVDGKEWVVVMAHLAHGPTNGSVQDVRECKWYLVSVPLDSANLGVSAWVRDGRGGLRSVSVPGGEYTKLWRLGCTVSDALGMAFDLPYDETSVEEGENALAHPHQIEDYVLRQQLGKLRGTLIADAQVQQEVSNGLPGTVRRSLDILRRFDPALDPVSQVKLVLLTEAETRCMAMRLQRRGPSDLRDRLHLLPAFILQRLPLSVLEWMALPRNHGSESIRTDLAVMLALAESCSLDQSDVRFEQAKNGAGFGAVQALHIGLSLAATGLALRGLVASTWGAARYRGHASLPERLPIPPGWNAPDASRQDPQLEYDAACRILRADDWAAAKETTPWQWMLALLGILDRVAPQVLNATDDNPLRAVYEQLRHWQSAPAENVENRQWAWPFDDLPTYDASAWISVVGTLSLATHQVDQHLGLSVRQVEAPAYRRHRNDSGFTDAESQQWLLAKLQYSGLGSNDSVARVQRGRSRLATWTEVRRQADNELLSVHTLDDKLGRWWHGEPAGGTGSPSAPQKIGPETTPATLLADVAPVPAVPGTADDKDIATATTEDSISGSDKAGVATTETAIGEAVTADTGDAQSANADATAGESRPSNARGDAGKIDVESDDIRRRVRDSQYTSWSQRGDPESGPHMRVALLQWRIEESYSHPLAEVGLCGMGMPDLEKNDLISELNAQGALAKANGAAARGKEHTWPTGNSTSVPSWPEHRRRTLLKRALEACALLKVELLVLPEVSVRRETVEWLDEQLLRHYPNLAVLAGTYRHFGDSIPDSRKSTDAIADIHPLMAPLTLLWRPDDALSKAFFGEGNAVRTLRFVRGKKYRAVAANELFRPDWNDLRPLFGVTQLLEQLGDFGVPNERGVPKERLRELIRAIAESMPPVRYCMELICSELFLLTSPANYAPLQREVAAMLNRFPDTAAADADEIVWQDVKALGDVLTVAQPHNNPRRTILLVPAATSRSNDYWHAGQASVLASGTATIFCNAAKSPIACGGSCFIGIDSATKPHANSAGIVETLTPYHGWRKGILSARAEGALSDNDQALVVVDVDPVHVVSGRPRPQLLPEPMVLVAYLPVVELLDPIANKVNLHQALAKVSESEFKESSSAEKIQLALEKVATTSNRRTSPSAFWRAFDELRSASTQSLDVSKLDAFAKHFSDPKAMRERLSAWERDRYQQPHAKHGPLNLEPAWLDFLDVDLTLRENQELPSLLVPPWCEEGEAGAP
ncbi:CHC2 zinc finger domain-containing protein [Paraburkholderia lycopersici]|uniref:DNA primase, catalytic core n=1 Tax=Paraburkholderia lycopersici TaxID=416944 RepID=A0A1G6UIJ1_9BURK|nr:CHC2 zinc finger domain-containing protein [Paraburkholderia lycopersici]SDD41074.1 DNA primase, catalytic core [Paraburkholderia lycopersici]